MAAFAGLSWLPAVLDRRGRVAVVVVVVVPLDDEPDEGGLRTGAFLSPVVVLLARLCEITLFVCGGWPSAEVGLTAGRGLVAVVDGGYLVVSLLGGSCVAVFTGCLTVVDLVRPVDPLLNVLVVVVEVLLAVVALLVRGLMGKRLGDPWRSASVVLVAVEVGLRKERERCSEDMMTLSSGWMCQFFLDGLLLTGGGGFEAARPGLLGLPVSQPDWQVPGARWIGCGAGNAAPHTGGLGNSRSALRRVKGREVVSKDVMLRDNFWNVLTCMH